MESGHPVRVFPLRLDKIVIEKMRTKQQVIDQEFLQIRAKILEIAAFFDRLDIAEKELGEHEQKLQLLQQGCQLLTDKQADKAARTQLLFSRQYESQWRTTMNV